MSSISLFETISVFVCEAKSEGCVQEPKNFFSIPVSAAIAVNPNGIKRLLANGLITLFINGNPVFSNGPRILSRNNPDCIIVHN